MNDTHAFMRAIPLLFLAIMYLRLGIARLLQRPGTMAHIKSRARYPIAEGTLAKWCKINGILHLITVPCLLIVALLWEVGSFPVALTASLVCLALMTANEIYTKTQTDMFFL